MPKETIHSDERPYGEGNPAASSVVEVRWDRETGYFQIATKCIERSTGEDYLPPAPVMEAIEVPADGSMVELLAPEISTFIPAQQGWYVGLDRRGINDLIRVLRRARDQAFGRDE